MPKDTIIERLTRIETLLKEIKDNYVPKSEFKPVKILVYGFVGLVLTGVVGAFLTGVLG